VRSSIWFAVSAAPTGISGGRHDPQPIAMSSQITPRPVREQRDKGEERCCAPVFDHQAAEAASAGDAPTGRQMQAALSGGHPQADRKLPP
jgi:hypothetical protein